MKKIGIGLFLFLIFWNILQEKINIEGMLIGLFISLFVYHFNKETFHAK